MVYQAIQRCRWDCGEVADRQLELVGYVTSLILAN
jgi:hypothetical protein